MGLQIWLILRSKQKFNIFQCYKLFISQQSYDSFTEGICESTWWIHSIIQLNFYPQLIELNNMFPKFATRTLIAATSLFATNVFCKQPKRQTYIWGNGIYQARPDALLQFHNFTPKKIQNLPKNLQYLAFGELYEAGIDTNGQLFIWEKRVLDANYDEDKKDSKREGITLLQKDVKMVKFTNGYIWTLTKSGKVYQWPIERKFDSNNQLIEKKIGSTREVEPLRGSLTIETGRDHIITLNQKGQIYAMGDDTYGQCGQADTERKTYPPFTQKRIRYPVKVKNLSDIVLIKAGADHNLAVDKNGTLYGWGSNSNLQLSHEDQFSRMSNPLICTYTPLKIFKQLDHNTIKILAAGEEFSGIVTENRQNKSGQFFTCGSNLRGQLAIDEIKHLKDVTKVDKLSNYVMKIDGKQKIVTIDQIQCGKNHCIALLNIGYVMQWGDNEYGQMGNKKRSPCLAPIVLKDFSNKKVLGVFAGENNSGVIVQEN